MGNATRAVPDRLDFQYSIDATATAEALTVAYTVNGTATNGVDYVELSGTVERAKLGHYHRHSY